MHESDAVFAYFCIVLMQNSEIGVRKKGQKQIAEVENGYVVKDDIETGYANVIPLWAFGLLY